MAILVVGASKSKDCKVAKNQNKNKKTHTSPSNPYH
jgi:hypothetical protein